MKRCLLFFYAIIAALFANAQLEFLVAVPNGVSDPLAEYNKHVAANWNGKHYRVGPYHVKGSPYLFGQAFQGNIVYKTGVSGSSKSILYDIYNQQAGVDVNGNLEGVNQPIEGFSLLLPQQLGDKILTFKPASAFGKNDVKGYFAVLAEGSKASLLKHYKAIVMGDPVNSMDREARIFEQVAEYYLFDKASGTSTKIRLREKDIVRALGNSATVKEFINTNKFDFFAEAEVIRFVSNYK